MKNLYLALIFPCVLFSYSSLAEDSAIQAQTQGEVTFVSGGVGSDEQQAMQAIQSNYIESVIFRAGYRRISE
jgi:hypothetical protein